MDYTAVEGTATRSTGTEATNVSSANADIATLDEINRKLDRLIEMQDAVLRAKESA